MKITVALFSAIFAMPRIFRNSGAGMESMLGVRRDRPGMTAAGLRIYFRQDGIRTAQIRNRLEHILKRYFELRDQMN